ncbi:hypothetical protein NDU88_006246 [Pleurodeles waltl]|uniref:Uncharacterized protein n=1 Tax=Pleurodeles waltl TaxID=8319 RepID=A0AAV7SNY9_PLEWA|nr:hypothetical protein NDU88_006246 [Pleurodeles waltl]
MAQGADDHRPPCPLSRASGTSAASAAAVREAGSSVGAVALCVELLAAAYLEETGGADQTGGVRRGHARPVAAAALGWASAVLLALGCLIGLGAPAHLCCSPTSGDLGRPWDLLWLYAQAKWSVALPLHILGSLRLPANVGVVVRHRHLEQTPIGTVLC